VNKVDSGKSPTLRAHIAFVSAILLLLTVFYFQFLSGAKSFFYTDTTFGLEPICRFFRDVVRSGHVPLWNSLEYCGMPQIAIPFPSIFYLPDYLFVVLPFNQALAVSMIFHQTVAAIGMCWLLRKWRLGAVSAITGGAIYALSGYMFSLTANYSLVAGAAWLPVCLYSLSNFRFGQPRKNYFCSLLSALALALLVLSGRPEVFFPSLILITIYLVVLGVEEYKTDKKIAQEKIAWYCRALFLAFIFCLPSVLSTAEWLSVSRRATGMLQQEVFLFSANWYDLISVVLGQSLGNLHLNDAPLRPLVSTNNFPPFMSCAYVGPAAFTFFLWGIFSKWKMRLFVLILLAVSLVAVLGDNCALVVSAVSAIPGLSFVRMPVKLFFMVTFAIAVCSAHGMEAFLKATNLNLVSGVFWLAICCASFALILMASHGFCCLPFGSAPLTPSQFLLTAQSRIGESGVIASVIGLLLTLISTLAPRLHISKKYLVGLSMSLLVGTLMTNAFANEHLGAESNFFEKPSFVYSEISPTVQLQPNTRVLNLCLERLTIPKSLLQGNSEQNTFASYQYNRELLKPNTNIDFSVPSSFGFEGAMKGDYYYLLLHSYLISSQAVIPEGARVSDLPLMRFCQLTSTTFIVTQIYRNIVHGSFTPVPLLDKKFFAVVAESDAKNIRIYRLLAPHPRCFVTHKWHSSNSRNDFFNGVLSTSEDSLDPVANPFVQPLSENYGSKVSAESATEIPDLTYVDNEHAVVTTNFANSGLVVLADQNFPGWQAFLDGKETKICDANGFMRSVFVPAGQHRIVFEYKPHSLLLGLALLLLGALLIVYQYFQFARSPQPN
jgi:hypothetical protein